MGDRDEQEQKMGDSRRDRSIQFSVPKVFSIAQTSTEIHRIGLGRKGGGRKQRLSEVENGESKVGESNQHSPE